MILHLFKLVWNRKGSNLLIVLEIFASFLVIFSLAATGLHLYAAYSEPLGYDWRDVWTVEVDRNIQDRRASLNAETAATFKRLMAAAASLPEVISAAGAATVPYSDSSIITSLQREGRQYESEISPVTAELAEVLRLDVIAGRWFEPGDEALDWRPVVIDRELARNLVGDADPLGVRLVDEYAAGVSELRVVGVVEDFRRHGELTENGPNTFVLARLDDPGSVLPIEFLILRLEPGTTAAFEEPLVRTLQSIVPEWSFTVTHMEAARASYMREFLIPLAAAGLVAGFLVVMVILGLTGVMWQNVTRRTREFGLRRATGAHRARIQRQIIGEVAVTAGLGVLAGAFLAAQAPLLGPFSFLSWRVVALALVLASAVILGLAALCGLYPGWSATRIHPAAALHYE